MSARKIYSTILLLSFVTQLASANDVMSKIHKNDQLRKRTIVLTDDLKFKSTGSNISMITPGAYAGGDIINRYPIFIADGDFITHKNLAKFDSHCVLGIEGDHITEVAEIQKQMLRDRKRNSRDTLFSFTVFDFDFTIYKRKKFWEQPVSSLVIGAPRHGVELPDHIIERQSEFKIGKITTRAGRAIVYELLPVIPGEKTIRFYCKDTARQKLIRDIDQISDILRGKIEIQ